jgi:hypothetical protein
MARKDETFASGIILAFSDNGVDVLAAKPEENA